MSAPDLATPIRLSVAAPAYNEAAGIEAVIANWHDFLAGQVLASFEIVVCDDGSTDGTGDILDRLTLPYPQLRVLHFAKNRGRRRP
jgi:glycosyltransferase involved in cell wall biosynthesis